jgi:hypothetical protein
MINFKQFTLVVEDSKDMMAIMKQGDMSLDEFINEMIVGKNFQQLMNMSSYINLYFGNKYGIGPRHSDPDQAIQDFTNNLATYFNPLLKPDRSGKRPRPDETPEFAEKHNKAEYDEYDRLYRAAWKEMILARRENDDRSFAKWESKRDEYAKLRSNTEFQRVRSDISTKVERMVKDMFATPISSEDVADLHMKYPREFEELQETYNDMIRNAAR